MVTTNDDRLAEKIRCLRDHGASISDLQRHIGPKPYLLADHEYAGYNQRMTDVQAALGSAQMLRADAIVAERRSLAQRYDQAFAGLSWLQTPRCPDALEHGYQSYPCLFQPEALEPASISHVSNLRNEWMEELQQAGISTRPATHAVHMLSYYRQKYGLKPADFPSAWAANDCSISLPLFHGMSKSDQDFVIEKVSSYKIRCAG